MSTISPTRRSDPRAATTPAAIPPYAYDDIGTPAAAHTVATHPSPPCVPRHVARDVAPHALYLPRPRHTRYAHPQSSARVVSPAVPVPHPLFTTAGYSVDRAAAASLLPICSPPRLPGLPLHWRQVREGTAVRLAATTRASATPILPDRTWCHGAWRFKRSFACDFCTATIKVL